MSDIEGMAALVKRMQALGETRPVMRVLQLDTIAEAHRRVPRSTGFLQHSIVPGRLTDITAVVIAGAPYAAPVEYGSKAHEIRPRKAKVLAWGGQRRLSGRLRSGAKPDHFAMVVHHPGTKAHPYLIPGAKAAAAKVNAFIVQRWNRAG